MSVQTPNPNAVITVKGPNTWKSGTAGMTLKSNDGLVCFVAQAQCNVAPGQYQYGQLLPILTAANAKWKVDQPRTGTAPAAVAAAPPIAPPAAMSAPAPTPMQPAAMPPSAVAPMPVYASGPAIAVPSTPATPPAKPIITAHLKVETIYSQLIATQSRPDAIILENAYYLRVLIDSINALRADIQALIKSNLTTFTPEAVAKAQAASGSPAIDINEEPNFVPD